MQKNNLDVDEDGGATILLFAPPSCRPAVDPVALGDIVLAVVMRLATDRPRVLVPVQQGDELDRLDG